MNFKYTFPAVKGVQAGKEYYISMVPLHVLLKIFPENEEYILPEFRAQRRINESRIPEIKNYILNNRNNYVFSALSASIDGDFEFKSSLSSNVGELEIDMNARFLINDGQHRRAAIQEALLEDESLQDEDISIVFFKDDGLRRSQQMFTDLNKHAVKTSNSLSTLYDSRDKLAVCTKELINNNIFLNRYTDRERDILGKNSSKLFTLNSLYKANQKILISKNISDEDVSFLNHYWYMVVNNINEWNGLINKEMTKKTLREDYIVTLAIIIVAFGKLGYFFYSNKDINMNYYLTKLKSIDWSRNNKDWAGRVINENGKVNSSEEAITLTYLKIKQLIDIELTKDELCKENNFMNRNNSVHGGK